MSHSEVVNDSVSFETFSFRPEIGATLKTQGFEKPTPIQAQAIPVVMSGKDVMGLAQTGTGKTAAFVLPMVQRLAETKARHVRAVIIAPTRELAQQIFEVVEIFGSPLGLKAMTAYGGVGMGRQVDQLRRGVDIIVACPGRLLDHMEQRIADLSKIEMLVLDEADQMFDMGFIPTIRRIIRALPKNRQTLLFSATMPEEIRGLAEQVLQNPTTVKAGTTAPVASVTHALYPVERHLKPRLVLELLKHTDTESVLIFVRTKHGAKRLADRIKGQGFKVTSLQGNLRQNQRERAMEGFRDGSYQIMVATDIAARGLDIASISHVINYDIPDTVEAYTHRIGRTGRAAKTGDAFTLVSPEDFPVVRAIEKAMKTQLERRQFPGFNYQASQKDIMREEFASEISGKPRVVAPSIDGDEEESASDRPPRRESRGGGQSRGYRGGRGRSRQGGGGGGQRYGRDRGQSQDSWDRPQRDNSSPREQGSDRQDSQPREFDGSRQNDRNDRGGNFDRDNSSFRGPRGGGRRGGGGGRSGGGRSGGFGGGRSRGGPGGSRRGGSGRSGRSFDSGRSQSFY